MAGQAPVSVLFTRRTCDTEPNPFSFTRRRTSRVGSNVTVEYGHDHPASRLPAHVSVIGGRYSIGCTGTFTREPWHD